jgi:hypothetical protein
VINYVSFDDPKAIIFLKIDKAYEEELQKKKL